jgi:chloramphenicol 3-O-phosphotransferase
VIVILNGASSAGKSTVARALQDAWDEPALIWGIDTVVTDGRPSTYSRRSLEHAQ